MTTTAVLVSTGSGLAGGQQAPAGVDDIGMHLSPAALGTAVQLLDLRGERGEILETAQRESVELRR